MYYYAYSKRAWDQWLGAVLLRRGEGMKKSLIPILILILLIPLIFTSCSEAEVFTDTVQLSRDELTLTSIGDVVTLTARVFINYRELSPEETEGKITWTSNDVGVAVCDGGVVEVLGYGNCVIRATYETGISATCFIAVPNPNQTLTISESELVLGNIGRTAELTATSDKGEDITEKVTWISSNTNIISCVSGRVTATGYGSCTITALSPEDGKKATCNVTVGDPTAPYIELKGAKNDMLSLDLGDTATLSATLKNGAGETVSWTSSDPSIATCERGTVTAVGRGVCAIIAMTELGCTDYVIVSVETAPPTYDHSELLDFAFNNVGRELLYINGDTGKTLSRSLILSYTMDTLLLDDGRLVVEISLHCVKTYDADGLLGSNAAVVTTSLFRENDIFCLRNTFKFNVDVGETFDVKCQGFTVQTDPDAPKREFYMTFSTITEE